MFKIALTGGPNAGKSTLIRMLGCLGYSVAHEAATMIINVGQLHPTGPTRPRFQRAMIDLQQELDDGLTVRDRPGFVDRGLYDGLAYSLLLGEKVPVCFRGMKAGAYDLAFVLDPLPIWVDDGVRYEDLEFSRQLTPVLEKVYLQHKVPVVRVPVMSVGHRLKLILDTISLLAAQNRACSRYDNRTASAQAAVAVAAARALEAQMVYAGVGKSVAVVAQDEASKSDPRLRQLVTGLEQQGFSVTGFQSGTPSRLPELPEQQRSSGTSGSECPGRGRYDSAASSADANHRDGAMREMFAYVAFTSNARDVNERYSNKPAGSPSATSLMKFRLWHHETGAHYEITEDPNRVIQRLTHLARKQPKTVNSYRRHSCLAA